MSGGNIFAGIAGIAKKAQDIVEPITSITNPIDTKINYAAIKAVNTVFAPQAPSVNIPQKTVAPTQAQAPTPLQQDNTPKSAVGAAQGPSGGAASLITNPPRTPEGDRMRLSNQTLLGGNTTTLLGT